MDMEIAERLQRARLSRIASDKKAQADNGGWVTASLLKSYTWNSSYNPLMDFSTALPSARSIKVPHVEQLCSWDCGLACVLMVLKTLGIEGHDLKSLGQLCCTSSIWTVDLAHLLRLFNIEVIFLTVTIGANPNFAVETFYKENMEEDGERVNKLFEKAPEVGIQVQWRSISAQELSKLILSGKFLAIALVDKRKLCYPWLEDLCLSDCCGMMAGYTGHYIVICGYNVDLEEFEIRDPASSSEQGRISLQALDEARKSFGTDEDLLLVSLESSRKGARISSVVPEVHSN
ncbi:hypothetical protein KP509_22G005500 [Ceratopteris richardii]|uniref:Guanylyl cyclase n=2 Tax=Ceratopteris richardii TaxID=49495 RepID=A0A8T2S507_CERRI|nr:hypothetical protein KP509_22G005500 [Ceratopteris richardii]